MYTEQCTAAMFSVTENFYRIICFLESFIQESVNWLVSKGRIKEADDAIRKVAKFNKRSLPDDLFTEEDIPQETAPTVLVLRMNNPCHFLTRSELTSAALH